MNEVHRPQFGLLELLVVMGCVGVLLGLCLPAIRYPNRPARRAQCQNNLRQFALAAMNFESTYNRLPANRQSRQGQNGPLTVGWVYDLLPYMEQQHLYDHLNRDAMDTVANQTRIPLLNCPNDSTDERPTATSYMANGGCRNNLADNFDAAANGVGDDLAGVFLPPERARITGCKDGSSQMIYYVENHNAQRWNEDFFHPGEESPEYFHVVNWLPLTQSELPSGFQSTKPKSKSPFLWAINEGGLKETGPEFARPSSTHPSGFGAAFVGGNTRYISESIDYRVYAQLLSSHGARTVDPADTSETRTEAVRSWQRTPLQPQSYE